jgi:short-subunit dehydrogenase
MNLAVITGGTKGIGKALVYKFAENGFAVATCARNEQALMSLKDEIEQQYNVPLHYHVADFAQKADVKAFSAYIQTLNLPTEVLINNAGVYAKGALLTEDEAQFEKLWRVNVESVYILTQALAPAMVARRQGHILNICSIASNTIFEHTGSYCATKFALYGMTKVLRQELKDTGVKVTAILPGATYTDAWAGSEIDPKRLLRAEDVAEAVYVAYQLSPQALLEELTIRPPLGDL